MADNKGVEGEPNAYSGIRRAATDPAQPPEVMEERLSQEREAPRVRFSEDLDRATASASTSQQARTLNLTIDTKSSPKKSSETPRPLSGILSKKATSPISPTSPRTRDRGYSLRRTLFNRSINTQSEDVPVELAEVGSYREIEGHSRSGGEESQSSRTRQQMGLQFWKMTPKFLLLSQAKGLQIFDTEVERKTDIWNIEFAKL